MGLFDRLRSIVEGALWGDVVPEQVPPPMPHLDARQHAVAALLDYLALETFRIDDSPNAPKGFRIPRLHLLDEWPDDEKTLTFPTIVALPGEVTIIPHGLVNDVDESTRDVFAPGTSLLVTHEHQERFPLEVWATTRFERAAIVATLERTFDPTEERSGLLLELPRYFDQVARFTLEGSQKIDDPDAARRRRRARMTIRLEVEVVRLVAVSELEPSAEVEVVSKDDPTPVTPDDPPTVP